MNVLFSHQNFPAQFGAFGAYLALNGWSVSFFTENGKASPPPLCSLYRMRPHRQPTEGVHRFVRPLERAMINGQAFANAAIRARGQGLNPDIVVAHSGWGSGTFAKAVWPGCKYVSYVEWFYRWPPVDSVVGTRTGDEDGRAKALAQNAPTLLDLAEADLVMCPTRFQASQFPSWIRDRIVVMHDGVDTDFFVPDALATPPLPDGVLPLDAEVVTYATRGMEPHRGFPEFMRALALLQKRRPRLQAIIGGEDRIAYGPKLADGKTWKTFLLEELDLDESRIHWTGLLPRNAWRALLQSTHVHVYLTVPFVLSWSLIEAMATGCPLVASRTPPVLEALDDGQTADLVDHTDIEALASAVSRLLDDRERARGLGREARVAALRRYAASWIYPARAQALADLAAS